MYIDTRRRRDVNATEVGKSYNSGLSMHKIAKQFKTTHTLILNRLKEGGIIRRPKVNKGQPRELEIVKKVANSNRGKKRNMEARMNMSIARKKYINRVMPERKPIKDQAGYILIYKPDHPRANKYGRVFEHIVVWEEYNKKPVPKGYVIHHLNGVKNDNKPENLVAMKFGEHINQRKPYEKRIEILEEIIARNVNVIPRKSSDNAPVCHVQNISEAKSLANFLWNEQQRHCKDIGEIDEDLLEIKQKWGISPSGERKFVIP